MINNGFLQNKSNSEDLINSIKSGRRINKMLIEKGIKEIEELSKLPEIVKRKKEYKSSGKAIVISAFPGTGKSFMAETLNKTPGKVVLDSDSSLFSKDEFPGNYIQHIKENLDKADIIFVSSHDVARKALREAGIFFFLVFPEIGLKEEYIKRYEERGSNPTLIKIISDNWDKWIKELYHESDRTLSLFPIVLKKGEYISNRFESIVKFNAIIRFDKINSPERPTLFDKPD